MRKKEKQGIIFDLDGTLWDSSHEVVLAWNEALKEFDELSAVVITDEDMHRFMGNTMDTIMDMMLGDGYDRDFKNRVLEKCVEKEHEYLMEHGASLYPGFLKTMLELKSKYELCIVSNSQDGYVQVFLRHFALDDLFDDFEMFGRTGLEKGDNIRLVMERRGYDRAIYVGDTVGDELASREAGAFFVHASYGFGKAENPDGILRSLEELPKLADSIFENA